MNRILRYASLSDDVRSTRIDGQKNRSRYLREIPKQIVEECDFHHEKPDQLQMGNADISSDREIRGFKVGDEFLRRENEFLRRENEYLRKQSTSAIFKIRKMKSEEDQIMKSDSSSDYMSVSSARSFKMRCSLFGRKKSKNRGEKDNTGGRCSPSDASTVVMGSKTKVDCEMINNTKSFRKKSFGRKIWRRYKGDTKRRNLSPTHCGRETVEATPPCTPEKPTMKNAWSSDFNRNRHLNHLNSPPWSLELQQMPQAIFQPRPLDIEACLNKSRSERMSNAEDMFLPFRNAVSSKVLTVDKVNLQEI